MKDFSVCKRDRNDICTYSCTKFICNRRTLLCFSSEWSYFILWPSSCIRAWYCNLEQHFKYSVEVWQSKLVMNLLKSPTKPGRAFYLFICTSTQVLKGWWCRKECYSKPKGGSFCYEFVIALFYTELHICKWHMFSFRIIKFNPLLFLMVVMIWFELYIRAIFHFHLILMLTCR